jgi:arylsulfatase A-like enzyme
MYPPTCSLTDDFPAAFFTACVMLWLRALTACHPLSQFPAMLIPPLRPALVILALALSACAVSLYAAPAAKRPNILFILTDDQRWDSLGLTGNPVVKTPHIDRLAGDGTFFPNGTINSAICTPSRVCFFLGQYERKHGVNFNSGTAVSLEAWAKSYPVLLREAGYFTGYVGKNHIPVGPRGYAGDELQTSFDFWYAANGHLSFYPKRRHPVFNNARADTQVEVVQEGVLQFIDPRASYLGGAESFLKSRPANQPFCLTVAFNVPHAGGTSTMELLPADPELYRTTYRDQLHTQPLPKTYVAKVDITSPKLPPHVLYTEHRQKSYDYVDTEDTLRERQIREYQTITGIDQFVGAVRMQLEKLGLADNTIILLTSDHGITHGEFGLGGKALNYDSCLRVPMIIMDPRVPANARGQRSPALLQSIDFAPTMLEYAGVTIPATMQGRSFRAAVEGRPFTGPKYAFAENLWSTFYGNPRCESVRSAEWKYIRYFANDRSFYGGMSMAEGGSVTDLTAAAYDRWLTASIRGEPPVYEELFHISVDPDETTNLANDPTYAGILRELREECQRLVTVAKGGVDTPPATVRLRSARGDAKGKSAKAQK